MWLGGITCADCLRRKKENVYSIVCLCLCETVCAHAYLLYGRMPLHRSDMLSCLDLRLANVDFLVSWLNSASIYN